MQDLIVAFAVVLMVRSAEKGVEFVFLWRTSARARINARADRSVSRAVEQGKTTENR